jgi:hypothetical protein
MGAGLLEEAEEEEAIIAFLHKHCLTGLAIRSRINPIVEPAI